MPSKISWTDETWNPVVGCTKCSPGCKNCYAERMAIRLKSMGNNNPQYLGKTDAYGKWTGKIECCPWLLDKPLHWKKPRRIFVCSMGDLFHKKVPFEFIDKVLGTAYLCPQHAFQILTKRPKRALEYFNYVSVLMQTKVPHIEWPLKNLHLGVSISNQAEADEKIPILLQIPAAVRFVSLEPLLGEIHLLSVPAGDVPGFAQSRLSDHLHWVIIGCESINGRAGRLLLPETINNPMSGVKVSAENIWRRVAADIVEQCKTANVPVFVKQIPLDGKVSKKMAEWPQELQVQEYPDDK